MYDVLAVNMKTHRIRLLATDKTHRDSEAIINFAIMRRGVDEEFYTTALSGAYADGDEWRENNC